MLKLGIPSKGRLMEDSFNWFADRGITLSRSGSDREYAGRVEGADLSLVLLSAGEIPRELASGRIDLGVTGSDLVREKLAGWRSDVRELTPMGFGHADLILAVPAAWRDCENLDDFAAITRQFRENHGFRLRIATKYHRLVRAFLSEAEIADYQLVDSQGATEGTVANLTAEAIADITSSGATLRANHLKILPDALIHASQATVFASLKSDQAEIDEFIMQLRIA
ncbi:ATP phosphoribosyltransferase [Paracoccus aerodenitrificans]|uniref:ATP phosphoribosyltransferase n=1 Tax=Paracoccus aerodenitrificans TaxID=3017781 RepID=UPI0022F08C60|nr:ATP phosphoribosyltransferase [Paracoccus aerodenitrificans]WBU62948.1 ATP phosphoribosyltransferase [Paracoccus aerodenitrificans]